MTIKWTIRLPSREIDVEYYFYWQKKVFFFRDHTLSTTIPHSARSTDGSHQQNKTNQQQQQQQLKQCRQQRQPKTPKKKTETIKLNRMKNHRNSVNRTRDTLAFAQYLCIEIRLDVCAVFCFYFSLLFFISMKLMWYSIAVCSFYFDWFQLKSCDNCLLTHTFASCSLTVTLFMRNCLYWLTSTEGAVFIPLPKMQFSTPPKVTRNHSKKSNENNNSNNNTKLQ